MDDDHGLNPDGTIAREGALDRVTAEFAPVVEAARGRISRAFGPDRLHSAYLYGSVPRGTAVAGVSDLDVQLALHGEPTEADRAAARELESALDRELPQIDGAGILLSSTRVLLSELERHDLGFFVACLCTPLLGPDLAEELPPYRPTSLLARETNGDLALLLPGWRARPAGRALGRRVGRRLVRTGFTLVMPRWGGWTSDLDRSAEVFGTYYPERAEQMRLAAEAGRSPSPDPAVLDLLVEDLAPWLAAEYASVHGTKTPR
ncbi:nucleotidyltransferase [Streptomyces sp. NRRL B-24572]|uniref:nucleotidyltransferase n=1 Tax=Streptomyces sp. NRRL B-24572 TaxID=1962156 RepID=UPI000A3BCB90|nr:nucleotidyltransferase [Streptomyces sp. NRRL B-24572]